MTSDSSPISRTISATSLMSFCLAKSVTVLTIERTTLISCIANADNARSYELIALLLNIFNALFALLCKLLCGKNSFSRRMRIMTEHISSSTMGSRILYSGSL